MLFIRKKVSLILFPRFLMYFQVTDINNRAFLTLNLIIKLPFPMKIIFIKASIISNPLTWIKKFPFPMHFVLSPLSLIIRSIIILKDTISIPLTILYVSIIFRSSCLILYNTIACIGILLIF